MSRTPPVVTLLVPARHVARVDRALKREGLDVTAMGELAMVLDGTPPADVPRVIAYDGPVRA